MFIMILIFLAVLPGVVVGRVLVHFTIKIRFLIPLSLLMIIFYSLIFVVWQSWVYYDTASAAGLTFSNYLTLVGINWIVSFITIINRRDVILKAKRGYA